jgi:hypothetical protein
MKQDDRRRDTTTSTRSFISRLREAAGVDKPSRDALVQLEGRQLLTAPSIAGTVAGQSLADSSTTNLFSGVTIADIDSGILSVEVQLDNSAKGIFTSGSLSDSGFSDAGSGRYTFFGSPSEATTALRALVFNPADNRVPVNFSETSRFTITVDDAENITTDNTTTVRSISSNDSPSSTGFTTSTTINDTATTTPFSGVTISDPDPFQTLSVVITLDAAAKGAFTSGSLSTAGVTAAGGGIYTVSGRAAAVTTAIRALVFQPTQNRVAVASTETTTFTVTVTDNIATPVTDSTTTVISTSVNNAPTISGAEASQGVLDNDTISPFTGVTIGDVDPATTLSISVTLDTAAKGVFTPGSLTDSGFVSGGGGVYTFSGTAAAATTAIRALIFAPTEDRVAVGSSETTTFTISADDSVAAATTDSTTTVVSSPYNNSSTITGTSAAQAVNDTGTVTPFSAVTIGDVDSPAQTLTLTVTLDSTSFGDLTGGSVSGAGFTDAGGGVYTRTGTASQLTTAIRALTFAPTADIIAIGTTETVGFTISVDDGIITATTDAATTVVITPVNDAASIGGASAGQATNDNADISPFSAITFSDADAPAQTFSLTVAVDTAAKGVFTPASLSAAGFTDAGGGSYTKSGTLAALQTAIRALSYNPTDNRVAVASTETTTFTITLSDGVDADVTNTTTTVVSTSVNVAPSIDGTAAGQLVDDNSTVSPFTGVTFADDDNNTLDITVTIDTAAKGDFTSGSLTTSGFVSAGGGVYTFTGTAAAATTAIRALVFAPTENRVAVGSTETSTFTVSADDSIAAATTDSTSTVISSAFNDASTIGSASAGQAVNDTATVTPFSALTIADPDSPAQTLTATVTLDAAAKGIFTSGSLSSSGFNDDGGGVYSRTGTASQLQTAIRQLVFNPSDNRVASGLTETTTFTVSITDGLLDAATDNTTTVVSTSMNDAPVIAGSSAGQTVNDNATVSPFSAVTFSDDDADASIDVTITLDTAAKGVFTSESLTASGFVSAGGGVYTFTGTPAAATTAIQALVFNATNDRVAVASTETTTFTIGIDDGATGTDTDAATTVISTSVNDAPTISGAVAAQAVNDNATITPFSAMTIADVDPSTTLSISVSLDDAAKGEFTSGSLTDSGFTDAGGGVYTFSGTASAATTAIRQLVFSPTANRGAVGSTETTTFTVSVDDSVASAVTDTASTAVSTSINDNPTVTGASAGQAVNDNATVSPFSGMTIGDVDSPAQTLNVTVTLDAHGKGAFTSGSLSSAGFTDQGLGVYTRSGTAAALTTAIRALVFNPTDDRVAVGSTETTTFTVAVTDSSSGSVSNATTTVVSTSMNDAPSVSVGVGSQAVNDTSTVLPFSTMTIGDADSTQSLTVTVTIDTAAKGVFTSASLTASGFVSAGGGVYTFTGTRGDATTAIRQLAYDPSNNRVNVGTTETTTFTVAADDGVAAAASDSATTVVSTSMNDAPSVSGTASAQAVNDNATVLPFATITIADADTDNQTIALSVTIDTAAKGSFTSGSLSGAGFTNAGGGVYTKTGTAAALTAAIRTLVFQPTENRVASASTETSTFTLAFNDGAGGTSSDATSTVVSTSINDAPTISGSTAGQTANDNATVSPFSGVTIADADASASLTVHVTVDTNAKGVFTAGSLESSGFADFGGGLYIFTGSAAAATTAIRALVFNPTDNRGAVGTTETTTFTIDINDEASATDSDAATTVVSTSMNDAAVISGVEDGAVLDNATVSPFTGVTISDADSPAQTLSISVTLSAASNGAFTSDSLTSSGFTDAGSGVYTFSGTAAAATTAIRGLVFQPVENRALLGTTETTGFSIAVDDGSVITTDATTDVVASPYNDMASITGAVASQAVNDTATLSPFSGVTISDDDSPAHMLTLDVTISDAAKGTFTAGSLSGFTAISSTVYRFTATAAAVTSALRNLVFQPTQNRVAVGSTETTGFTLSVSDSVDGVNTTNSTTTVVSTSMNNAPSMSGVVTIQSTNDNATSTPFSAITLADVDPSDTVTITVTIGNTIYGAFTEESIAAAGMTLSEPGTYTFTGSASAATAAVRQLVYSPTANAQTVESVYEQAFDLSVADLSVSGGGSQIIMSQTSVNDAPTISGAEADQAVNDNATITPFSAMTIADVDFSQTVTLTVVVGNPAKGDLTSLSVETAGFTNQGDGIYTFSGSASAATSAIRQLAFAPAANRVSVGSTETSTFTVVVNDGVASNVTNTTTTVVSTSINNAPTISGAEAGVAVNDNATVAPFSGMTIADVDPSQSITLTVFITDPEKGNFTAESMEIAGFSYEGSGTYIFTGLPEAATNALRALVFAPTANYATVDSTATSNFTITVSDGVAEAVTDTTTTVVSTSINDAPELSGAEASQAVNDNATTTPFAGMTVSDVDQSQSITLTVAVDDTATGTFTSGSVEDAGFTDQGNGVFTFTGLPEAATTALRALVFAPTANRVAVGSTETSTFTVIVSDSIAGDVSDTTTTVVSTSINNAPTVSGVTTSQAVNDNATITPFGAVTIADVDPSQQVSVFVSQWNSSTGSFTSGSLAAAGFTTHSTGVYRFNGTAAQATTAIRQLVFTPSSNRVSVGSTETSTFSINVYDASGAATGGTASAVATSVNDAPTLSGASTGQAVNDTASLQPFATITIGDVDPSQALSVFVAQWNTAAGSFTSGSLSSAGFTQTGVGTYRFNGTAAAATTAIRTLVYRPTADRAAVGSTETSTFSVVAYDAVGQNASGTVSAVSTSINDAPTIGGTAAAGTVLDTETVQPFATTTIGDVDPSGLVAVTVAIDSAAKGSFTGASLTSSGFSDAGNGAYTFTGTAAAATTAIRALVFSPTLNRLVGGDTETATFTISVTDGTAPVVTNSGTTVVAQGVNNTASIGGLTSSLAIVRVGQAFTLTARDVADSDGSVTSVQFWRDSDNDGDLTDSDELVGTATSGSGDWSLSATVAEDWGVGSQIFFATAIDNDAEQGVPSLATQITTQANTGALIVALTANRTSATFNQSFTLTASGVEASVGTVRSVAFYFDSNRDGLWDSRDKKLATDSSATGGYTAMVKVPTTWTVGESLIFARATDSAGLGSPVAMSFTVAANVAPNAGTIVANPTAVTSNNRVTLTLSGATDEDGSIKNVAWFADTNGNGIWDSADRRLGSGSSAANSFRLATSLTRSWARDNAFTIFARVTDNNGGIGTGTLSLPIAG